jgi:hypothetical protein
MSGFNQSECGPVEPKAIKGVVALVHISLVCLVGKKTTSREATGEEKNSNLLNDWVRSFLFVLHQTD